MDIADPASASNHHADARLADHAPHYSNFTPPGYSEHAHYGYHGHGNMSNIPHGSHQHQHPHHHQHGPDLHTPPPYPPGHGYWPEMQSYFYPQNPYSHVVPSQGHQSFGGNRGGRGGNSMLQHAAAPGFFDASAGAVEAPVDERSADFCKALAKVAKPRPPWSIGAEPTNDISVEIQRLEAFFAPSAKDSQQTRDVWDAVKNAVTELSPSHGLQYTGCNSWSFFPFRGRLSVAAPGVPTSASSQLSAKLFKNGCRIVREFVDGRGLTCYLVEHSETKREVILRIGDSATTATETVRAILAQPMDAEVRSALNAILILLRQSKIVDDIEPSTMSDEGTSVMVLAIAHSYQDRPSSERLLIDFFLTYGFKAHFDTERFAVNISGMVNPVTKSHKEPLAILDPANPNRNLAAGITAQKLQFMQSTYNYCYHVISEFSKETDPQKQRGQSPLSTILGGEPFWPRVVDLAALSVEPYVSFLNESRNRAIEEMRKQRTRKGMQPHRR